MSKAERTALAGELPACPMVAPTRSGLALCGQPIESAEIAYGFMVRPAYGPKVFVAGGDPMPTRGVDLLRAPDPWPDGDRLVLRPCGHALMGDAARELYSALMSWRAGGADSALQPRWTTTR